MEPIVISEGESSSTPAAIAVSTDSGAAKPPKTPAALLEEYCQKNYGCQPTYSRKEAATGMHAQLCIFKGYKGAGMARNKQAARHIASLEILLHLAKQEEWPRLGIPVNSSVEAEKYLKGLLPDLHDPEKQEAANENWVGKCNELCSTKRLGTQPDYEFESSGPPNLVVFVCTCTLREMQTKAEGRKKQQAKNLAAKEMYALLQQLDISDYNDRAVTRTDRAVEASGSGADVTQPSGDVRSAAATAVANPASKAVPRNDDESESAATETPNDPMFEKLKAALREVVLNNKREHCAGLLSELLKTDNPHVSKVFASAEIAWIAVTDDPDRGLKQIFLEVKNRTSKERLSVFAGEGSTEQAAKDHAAWLALNFLYVYGGFADGDEESDVDDAAPAAGAEAVVNTTDYDGDSSSSDTSSTA